MKKFICMAVMAAILAANANAAEITEVKKNIVDSEVTVSVSEYNPEETLNIRVLYPGVTALNDGRQTNTIAWIGETVTDSEGKGTFTLKMPQSTNGEIIDFLLDITDENGGKISKTLKYIDNNGLAEAVKNVKSAQNAETALNEITAKAEAVEIEFIPPWKELSQSSKNKVAEAFYAVRNGFSEFDEMVAELNYQILQAALSEAESETAFSALFDAYKYMFDDALFDEIYNEMSDSISAEFRAIFYNARKELDGSREAFGYTMREAVLKSEIKKLDRNAPLIKILSDYSDVITHYDGKMDSYMKRFKSADGEKQLEVCNALLEKRASDMQTVCSIIKDTLDGKGTSSGGGSSSSSGGGSGSSGSGKKTGGYSTNVPYVPDKTQEIKFDDLSEGHYAYGAVRYLVSKGVVNGYEENGRKLFKTDNAISREEFVKMVLTAFGFDVNKNAENRFSDVKSGDWFEAYVNTASELGIINGISETKFGTGENISREDMCTLIYRAMLKKGIAAGEYGTGKEFSDETDIADYALNAVKALKNAGAVNGDENGNFRPSASAARGETAKVLYKILTFGGMAE